MIPGGRTGWAGTFRTPARKPGGRRAWMGRFPQATTFRKTDRTDKPACRLRMGMIWPG